MKTPTLNKMLMVKEDSQKIGEFLEWLQEENFTICRMGEFDYYIPARQSIEEMCAKYFNIDLKKAEKERQGILDEFRKNAEGVK
jgi:NAD-specific glutamate dehydrogenase